MLKLKNPHKSYFDCLDDCFASIIQYYNKEYMYIFANAWRVNTYSNGIKNTITDLLIFCNICDVVDKFCGLKSDIKNFYKYDYMEEYLIQCLKEDKPVIISIDMFGLPWSEYFQKVHSTHFVIIIAYSGNHKFKVFDVTKQIDSIELDLKDTFDGNSCTVVLSELGEKKVVKIEDIMNISKENLQKDVKEGGYDTLFHMADYYFKDGNTLFDLAPEQVEAESFINRLLYFGRQRLAFSEFLKYAAIQTGDMTYQSIIIDLGEIGAKWVSFRNKIMKIRIKGIYEEKREELRSLWIRLVQQDIELYERYVHFSNKEIGVQANVINLNQLIPYNIDISKQFNSNAFNSNQWNNRLGFDLNGYFYELNQEKVVDETTLCDFKFYVNQQLDNMSCNKQTVSIMLTDVKAILLVGSCENGDFLEDLCVTYDKGEENVSLIFPDWWECNRFNEKVVKKLNCHRLVEGAVHNMGEVYIFSQVITLEKGENKLLQYIKFPDCSNIHIFGLIVYT